MKLRQLRYFVEISELGSVTRAAERLHVAQPALSRQLRQLEGEVGVQLFHREGRGIVLTKAGAVFRDRVRAALRDLDRAEIEARSFARLPGGHIDIGLPCSVSQVLLGAMINCLRTELSDVTLRVVDGWSGFIIEWLVQGRLDLGIFYDHTLKSDFLWIEPLASEEQFLVCHSDDPLAVRQKITLTEVARLPLVLPSREHGLRLAVEKFMSRIGCAPMVLTELESMVGLKQMVQKGTAYTILPKGEMEVELVAGVLRPIRIVNPTIYRKLFIARSSERPNTQSMQAVLDMIKSESRKLIESGAWEKEAFG